MDAEDGEDSRWRTDDETVARKRARRVSFADTTAIHVFDRDEDYETPPDTRSAEGLASAAASDVAEPPAGGPAGDASEEDEGEEEEEAELFVKTVLDFSPGSAAGSVTSNDDENLFGPVSMSFIKAGRLSEASEDNNHDITLDSTAFSLHFHNLLPPEYESGCSAGSLRTPTGDSMPDSHESFMRGAKKRLEMLTDEMSGDGISNFSHMSLVTKPSMEYDYGKLSPRLEAFLMKVNQSIQMKTPKKMNATNEGDMILHPPNIEACSTSTPPHSGTANEIITSTNNQLCKVVTPKSKITTPVDMSITSVISHQRSQTCLEKDTLLNSVDNKTQIPSQSKSVLSPPSILRSPTFHTSNALEEQPMFLEADLQTPVSVSIAHQQVISPLKGSVSSVSNHGDRKSKVPVQTELILSPPLLLTSPAFLTLNTLEEQPELLEADLQTPVSVSIADEQGIPPLKVTRSSLHSKRKDLLLDSPVSSANYQVSPLRSEVSHLQSKTAMGTNDGKVAATKNELSSFMCKEPQELDIVKLGSPTVDVNCLQSEISSTVGGKIEDISGSQVVSAISNDADDQLKNGANGAGRLKINFEINSQGLLSPIKIQKLTYPDGHGIVAIPEVTEGSVDRMAVASGVGGSSETNILQSKALTPESSRHVGLGIAEDQRGLLAFQNLLSLHHGDLSARKRKGEDVQLKDGDLRDKTGRNQKSFKVLHSNSEASPQGLSVKFDGDTTKPVMPAKSWKDAHQIFAKVSSVTLQKFSSSFNMLNSKEIDIFHDMLGLLEKSRQYESLHVDIQSMVKHHQVDWKHHDRVMEVKILQDKLLFKRLKLMLMHSKRDSLLKKNESMHSQIEECHKQRMVSPVEKDSDKESAFKNILAYPNFSTAEQQKIITKEKELDSLERKLFELIQFFEGFCKLKSSNDPDAFINLLDDYLDKRRQSMSIRRKLLLWTVDDVVTKKDGCVVVLNYCDVLLQSFSFNTLQGSVFSFKTSLNNSITEKRFPSMNACVALGFVFKDVVEQEIAGSKYLQQVTQTTSLLLSNILDLLEEVQAVRFAVPNLLRTVFHSSSVGQLGLDLCFRSYKELALTIDVSDLNCGVFPSEPSKVQIQSSAPSAIKDELVSTLRRLEGGRSMIKRLCGCVSDIVRAHS